MPTLASSLVIVLTVAALVTAVLRPVRTTLPQVAAAADAPASSGFRSYVRSIFSGESPASFGRWATAVTTLCGCIDLTYVVLRTHALPDGGALAGLATFMTAPYAVNKAAAALTRDKQG